MNMSVLPGITDDSYSAGLEFASEPSYAPTVTHFELQLPPMNELILEIDINEQVKLKITKDLAEINGTELATGVEYVFKGPMKLQVFTFKGCSLQYDGLLLVEHKIVEELSMNQYVNITLYLEKQRLLLLQMNVSFGASKLIGPRVMIVGPGKCGKSWLSRTLVSYLLKMDHQVMLVNSDPQRSIFVCPGLLTATPISDILNVENVNFGETEVTGSSYLHAKQPLVKSYGLDDHRSNPELYQQIMGQIASAVRSRFDNDVEVCSSGLVLDAATGLSEEMLDFFVERFNINIVISIESEWVPSKKDLQMVKLKKSENIIEETDQYIRQIQQRAIREYFYGIDKLSLSPYTLICNYTDLKIVRPFNKVKDSHQDETLGKQNPLLFVDVEVNSSSINNSILSIPRKQNDFCSCMGFVCVLSCDDEKQKCRILLPSPSNSLPSSQFVLTDFRYYE